MATGVVLSGRPIIYCRREGQIEEYIGQIFGGGGRFIFDDPDTAGGYFYDTNYALLKHRGRTHIKRFGTYSGQ